MEPIKDFNLENFHYEEYVTQDGTFSYIQNDNEDNFIDINIIDAGMCVIEPHISCSRVAVLVVAWAGKEALEEYIKRAIDKFY